MAHMNEIWSAEIFTEKGASTGIKSILPDVACLLELAYELRRSGRREFIRVMPPASATERELATVVEAGVAILQTSL